MKKTFITLLALAGVAGAATTTYTPLSDQEGWETGCNQYATPASFITDATNYEGIGVGALYGSGWCRVYGNYRFDEAITLSEGATLDWSFDLQSNGVDSIVSVTFETTNKNVMMGSMAYKDTRLGIGETTSDSDNGYTTQTGWGQHVALSPLTDASQEGVRYTAKTAYTMSGVIYQDNGNYKMTVKVNDVLYTTVDLGETFALEGIVFTADGANGQYEGSGLSNLSLNVVTPDAPSGNVPEPATATLSLLALAGLCARRRRA